MRSRSPQAIGCLCLGIFLFSIQDLVLKFLSGTYPVTQAMTIRAVVALPILSFLVWASTGTTSLRSPRMILLIVRAVTAFGAYLCYYMAVAALPLADAVALSFVAPLMIAGLAILVLGESLTWPTLAALVAGLVGVVIILRPGEALFEWAALLMLLSAGLYSTAQVLARKLGDSDSAQVITFYQNLAFILIAPLLAILFRVGDFSHRNHPSLDFLTRPWTVPSLRDFLLMAACGVIFSVGMTLISQAYRLARAARVSVFEYSAILWAPLWGFVFFSEVPHITTVVGAAIICGAGLLTVRRT
ncbi:DMT family transporter [Mesorhizobium sp. M0644]|uniref:DMT family transporter n=1 Tax=unclassified Mesorhizobium TaxID=325217 RepID=UPI00333D9BD6